MGNSYDPDALNLNMVKDLKNLIVGDQSAKLNLFLGDRDIIEKLINNPNEDKRFHLEKIDILLSLMNLEEDARNDLDEVYVDMIIRIFSLLKFDKETDLLICYKYLKLENLCLDNCEVNYLSETISFKDTIPHISSNLLIYHLNKYSTGEWCTLRSYVVIEMLKILLKTKCKYSERLLNELMDFILSISKKYLYQLDFKYTVKIPKSGNVSDFNPISNEGLKSPHRLDIISIPRPIEIHDSLDAELLQLSILLYLEHVNNISILDKVLWMNNDFSNIISSFLKSKNIGLRCCALKFLIYPYMCKNVDVPQPPIYQWLPYLIDSFNYNEIPWWFNPLEALKDLVVYFNDKDPLNNKILDFLYKTDIINGLIVAFCKCLSLKSQSQSLLKTISIFLGLFAAVSSYDEKFRLLLLDHTSILEHLEVALKKHLDLLTSFLKHSELINNKMLPGEKFPPFYTNEITSQWLLLLKSFSRSVNLLRTSLKRDSLAKSLLALSDGILHLISKASFLNSEILITELKVLSQCLLITSNFVVEFSNLQILMIKNGVLNIVRKVLTEPLFISNIDCNHQIEDIISSEYTSAVTTAALWVLRHLVYNTDNNDKICYLSSIPLKIILQFVNDNNWSVQEQCFQVIRNLSSTSKQIANMLLESFDDTEDVRMNDSNYNIRSTYFFDFLTHKLHSLNYKDSHQLKTMEAIIYIVVNFTAINENKRQLVIKQIELLDIIKTILSESAESCSRFGNNKDNKRGCLWILTNLIWNSSFNTYGNNASQIISPDNNIHSSSDRLEIQNNPFLTHIKSHSYVEDSDDDIPCNDSQNSKNDFIRVLSKSSKGEDLVLERYKVLEHMGFYELVKSKTFDDDSEISEKAKTLLFHMDLLHKGTDR